MKRLSTVALMAVLVLGLSLYLGACSSGGGGGSDTPPAQGDGTITNNTQGTQAASSSTQGASMAQGSGTTFQNLGSVGLSATIGAPQIRTSNVFKPSPAMKRIMKTSEKFAKSRAANAVAGKIKRAVGVMKSQTSRAAIVTTGTEVCADGGSAAWNVTFNDVTSTFTADITFASCREDDAQMDGVYAMTATASGTGANLTITLGPSTAFTIMDYSSGYAALIAKSTMTGFEIGINMTQAGLDQNLTMSAVGTMSIHDYFSSEDYTLTFSNGYQNAMVISIPTSTAGGSMSTSITTNGNFSETWTDATGSNSVAASFANLKLDSTMTTAYEDFGISGSFTITFTPASCQSGTFTFVTSPLIRYDNNLGRTTQGKITINGVTTVTFNADGTITVATAGTSQTYDSEYDLEQVCPMATLDEEAPVSTGSTGTVTSGAGMTITLTWENPNGTITSDSDMDLHLVHYPSTTPTSGTSDWDVDFGNDGVDLNSDGIFDFALDIDDLHGYGPEHITAAAFVPGYYVVSVNAYSFHSSITDTSARVNVSIQIGNSLFGPYATTLSTDDLNGTDPAAWFAAADIVVDSSGNISVKAHDANLPAWPSTAVFAAKKLK